MMRVEGWEHRLADLLDAARTRPFAYGTWDCCLFACAAIGALTGDDPGAPWSERYTDEASCAAVLERDGGVAGIAATVAAERGFQAIPPLLAQRGDILLGTIGKRDMLGVCVGSRVAFAIQPAGLAWLTITSPMLRLAWRIG